MKNSVYAWIICGAFVNSSVSIGDFSYVVQIHSSAKSFEAIQPSQLLPDPVTMTSHNGKQFQCFLPRDGASLTERSIESNQPQDLLSFGRAQSKKLTTCVHWVQDGSRYEICPNVLVRKIQLQEKAHEIFSLGSFAGDVSQPVAHYSQFDPLEFAHELEQTKQPLYTQRYGRHVIVQYLCGDTFKVAALHHDATANEYYFLVTANVFCTETSTSSEDKMSQILQPLVDQDLCIKKNEGWWTYEFCFGVKLRQYHREQSGDVTIDFSLGEFDHALNTKLEQTGASFTSEYLDGTHEEARTAFIQEYTGGTQCDETSALRNTRVLFYCSSGTPNHFILSVKEVQTCSYIMKIATPTICAHPKFSTDEKRSQEIALSVHCIPIDN